MSMTGAACRQMRQLLGVYVVGAIEPAERALVDEHLAGCASCRDELAGLAGLPAMLGRVPGADVARLAGDMTALPPVAEPSPELLDSLLRRVSTSRRTRMWRGLVAVAAAAVIAAGAATGIMHVTGPGAPPVAVDVATGANAPAHIAAVVKYFATASGTSMRVQVAGIKLGTFCHFWVITSNGRSSAGSWTVSSLSYGTGAWYPGASSVAPGSVKAFQITADGRALVTIPA
jgi:predicted anti-sigma-YlaC factor YlaD